MLVRFIIEIENHTRSLGVGGRPPNSAASLTASLRLTWSALSASGCHCQCAAQLPQCDSDSDTSRSASEMSRCSTVQQLKPLCDRDRDRDQPQESDQNSMRVGLSPQARARTLQLEMRPVTCTLSGVGSTWPRNSTSGPALSPAAASSHCGHVSGSTNECYCCPRWLMSGPSRRAKSHVWLASPPAVVLQEPLRVLLPGLSAVLHVWKPSRVTSGSSVPCPTQTEASRQ
eukprot:38774-Rhodomonas_salina.1